jgi:tetratricopeptide (TPR) repeat protein
MSRIVRIASWKGKPRASVVFVHGLGGHVYDTWRRAADDDTFWPVWLARDVEGLAVYSLAYEAPASNWLGTSMPLQDRAANIFELLLTEPGLQTGPIVFVCHSLGGLIVKKVLLNLQQQAMRRPEAASLLERVTEVVFAATPHTGSAQATWLDRLRFLAWPSSIARVLVANDPALRDINVAYRGLADDRRNTLRHQIFYETRDTSAGEIVDEASADPGLPGDPPVPIDADHISIVKPEDRSSLLYMRVRQFVELNPAVAGSGEVELAALPVVRSDQPLNIAPKLIRVCMLALAALIVFKGVQALIAPVDIAKVQAPLVDRVAENSRQLAKALDILNDMRTTPALPGADQQLKKAIVAIDEGAKVDSRYAEALELLKAGKPSEAEPLLKAVAEDQLKSGESQLKSAENANKKAAAAFRNLASIAAVSDPGRARENYAKAAQLDPDNIEGVIWNGWYQLLASKLDAAQAAFERAASIGGQQDLDLVFWARTGLGDVLLQRGDRSGALKSYKEGFVIADKLAKSDPGNTEWQRNLSVYFSKVGDVQVAQGDLPDALKSYEDGLAITDRLAKSNLDNAAWQRDLTLYFSKLGDVQAARDDQSAALVNYEEGLAVMEKLAKSNPGDVSLQRDLSAYLVRIGSLQIARNDLTAALKSYENGLAIMDKLAKSDPGNDGWQRDLSAYYSGIGNMKVAQGDRPGALKSYRDGLAITDRLARLDPGNAIWQRDLSLTFEKIGDVQIAQNDLPGALKSYKDSLAIKDRTAKSDPGNGEWQRDLSVSFNRVGDVLAAQVNPSEAIKSYRDGLAVIDKVTKSNPDNVGWQRDLSVSFGKIGDTQVALGDVPGALKSYRDSLAITDRLAKSDPANAGRQRDLSLSLFKVGIVLKAQHNTKTGLDTLRQGRDIVNRLIGLTPEDPALKKELDAFDKAIRQ